MNFNPESPVYFAHPVSDYGTEFEHTLLSAFARLSIPIENPNQPHHQNGYLFGGMDYFVEMVLPLCRGCIYAPFRGGMIGAGVATEVEHFLARNLQVLETGLDPNVGVYLMTSRFIPEIRILSREETRGAVKVFRTLPNGGR
jgi:hypothetical protein